ncbi:hypothetical protein EC973_008914 [Apophysomyces ossiformis]|uniref:Uncharacterized protein n=1 Tax=Apophysomyces ossiformis TaxID=679940 RepID=A0A8H7BKH9_9FUNG|nr:hypothetical protein EC973_008914 [Apophysomyces ossiformis]
MELKNGSTLRRGGGGTGKRAARTVNPVVLYDFALRCAIRACLEQNGNQRTAEVKKERTERHSVHLGVSEALASLSEKFGEDRNPERLTREIVRGLLRRMDDIRKGRDISKPEYQDPRYVSVVAQVRKNLQQHRFRPTGTVNDLVIVFLKTSEAELKRSNPNPAAWYEDLNRYIASFTSLVIQTVQEDAPSSATPELMEKLRGFLGPSKATRQHSDRRAPPGSPGAASPLPASDSFEALENFPMVKTVQELFQVTDIEHRRKLRELQSICTESALLMDLKQCINNVHTNQPFPGRREDFADAHTYDNWQKREVKQLTELMKTLMLMNPNLALNSSSEMDVGSSNLLSGMRSPSEGKRGSVYGDLHDASGLSQGPFTFIPNDPRSFFRLLMNMCIDYDTNVTPESERAKTSVLSQQSDELLRECWKTWRLSTPFRALLYVELVKTRYDAEELDFEDVKDAVRALDKALKENDIQSWTINDREALIRVYEGLNHTLLHALAGALSEYWKIKIYENPAYLEDHANPLSAFEQLEETVEGAAVVRWRGIEKACNNPEKDDLTNLLAMADKLIKELVTLTKRKFKSPIKGILSVPGIVMARQMPFFALEMENWAYLPDAQDAPIEITFELYHKVLSLKRLYDQHGQRNKTALFKVEFWFLQHVRRWLKTTNAATPTWVENAIKQDEFKRINDTAYHSSSVVDLFTMFHEAVDFVQNLQWPNELQRCRFLTVLSKVISVSLEQYTNIIEEMITDDIYPRIEREEEGASSTFLNKARNQLIGSRHSTKADDIPSDFTPELCVKINDIEAARARLDKLYQIMDVDDVSVFMRENAAPVVEKTEQTNFLYSIKIVRAENLQPLDNNGLSDPYVVLEIDGKQITRTRTVYETLSPRWDQVFDIWLNEKTVDVLAVVYDEDLIGANEECGGVWFKLSPEYFDDYQTHELVLNLHPQGKLILRVSMEGEKDDIQFWFGKAFRTLKRAENDAAGLIVDKMGRYMRQCLSRRTLDKLLGRDRSFFSTFSRNHKHVEPSLQDCEDAIAPLLDYLEKNLKILNDNLSETNMQLVILRIWKEILLALEGVLLPPLSEHPSDLKPLDDYEFHVVFKWLELLKVLFNGGEDGDAVPIDKLENSQYYALLAINVAYNLETDKLIESYHEVLKNQMEIKLQGGRKADRSKSVYHSRHTARRRKTERKSTTIELPNSETILRILRMRSGKKVKEFLRTEFDKRNNPVPPPPVPPPHDVNPHAGENDQVPLPVVPEHIVTP